MAKVKFRPVMRITTLDYPEVVRFVRRNYQDVIIERPETNFYNLIIKYRGLPLRNIRYCCKELKEQSGEGTVTITGVRREESIKRAKRNEIEIAGHKYSNSIDQFNIDKEQQIVCVNGKDKILLSPILDWTNSDVWNFIRDRRLEYCKLYDEGYTRIGCIFCPFSSFKTKQRDRLKYPKIEQRIKLSIAKLMKEGIYTEFTDENEVFNWWISGLPIKKFKGMLLNYKIDYENSY